MQFSKEEELKAAIRNKITLPLLLLSGVVKGDTFPKERVEEALNDLVSLVDMLE